MAEAQVTSGKRPRRFVVAAVLALAFVIGLVSMFAVWVDRQALNPENGTQVSANLLENEEIRDALGAYMVDELFTAVDVRAELQKALPPEGQALAVPAAAGLRELADRAAPRLLARPRIQAAWQRANLVARTALVRFLTSDNQDAVVLNLNGLITTLAGNLGLPVTVPPDAGRLEIVKADQIETARNVAKGIQDLALWGSIVTFGLFGLAVYLAVGWRRIALRRVGWCMVGLGLTVVLIRRVVGNRLVDDLVPTESVQPAAREAWLIITQILYDIGIAMIGYGAVVIVAVWLAGTTRLAVGTRRALAPPLRFQPAAVYAVAGFLYLLVLLWGPTPATRAAWGIITFAIVLVVGIEVLRRRVAREFPDAKEGETAERVRALIAGLRPTRGADRPEPKRGAKAQA